MWYVGKLCIYAQQNTHTNMHYVFINCVYMRSKNKLTEGDLHFICSIYSTQWATCYVQLYIIIKCNGKLHIWTKQINFALLLKKQCFTHKDNLSSKDKAFYLSTIYNCALWLNMIHFELNKWLKHNTKIFKTFARKRFNNLQWLRYIAK